ncbi:MAG TPA: hypothetical protein VMB34_00925 [Acetobacteraceae bacterium]|nr:hypothetical protein [Acetobacteraceae bacterium]
MNPAMRPGTFVRVLFPTREKPRAPGLLHIGYVLIFAARQQEVIVAYTTSQPWARDVPLPAGARLFDTREAASLNQSRPFLLRMDLLARLPATSRWFPDLDAYNRAVIATASPALQSELTHLAVNIGRWHRELLEMRGP